jgi:hypothetical protein
LSLHIAARSHPGQIERTIDNLRAAFPGHPLSDFGSALRGHVDDGVRLRDTRSEKPDRAGVVIVASQRVAFGISSITTAMPAASR